MANDRGLLPKARREDLPDELRRRLDRWYRDAYADDNLFLTMARRPGLLDATMGFVRYTYGGAATIEPALFESGRRPPARQKRSVHGRLARSSSAVRRGATEALVAKLADYERSDLPGRTKAALRYVDRLTSEVWQIDGAFYDDLRRDLSDDELLDLGMVAMFFN